VEVFRAVGNHETMQTGAMGTPGHAGPEGIEMFDLAESRFCEQASHELAAREEDARTRRKFAGLTVRAARVQACGRSSATATGPA
jgi:hypothetical protein